MQSQIAFITLMIVPIIVIRLKTNKPKREIFEMFVNYKFYWMSWFLGLNFNLRSSGYELDIFASFWMVYEGLL